MVTVAQQHCNQQQHQQQHPHQQEHQNAIRNTGDHDRGVTILDVDEDSAVDASSLEDRGYGTDAVCVESESDIRRLDEDVSHTSSTQYSDVDDSLDADESGSWSNDLDVPASIQQHFDNGVALPISEAPTFGDVCVKNSANVHFGNKTCYNGPVTIKQVVYANPNVSEDNRINDDIENDGNKASKETVGFPGIVTKPIGSHQGPDYNKVMKWCSWLLTWRCVALMCAMGSCLVATVVVSVVLLSRHTDLPITPGSAEIPDSSLDAGGNVLNTFQEICEQGIKNVNEGIKEDVSLGKVRFVERAEWGAQPPTEPLTQLQHPVPYVFISHTATDFCRTQAECTFRVRFAQTFHIESRNWSDIAYNFLVGGDGYAYVGRSWDYVGAHTYDYNSRSIGISLIGTFNTVVPPKRQLHAVQQLIEMGVKGGKISTDYKLLGHRQVSQTLSPGDMVYNEIKTWSHWSPKP